MSGTHAEVPQVSLIVTSLLGCCYVVVYWSKSEDPRNVFNCYIDARVLLCDCWVVAIWLFTGPSQKSHQMSLIVTSLLGCCYVVAGSLLCGCFLVQVRRAPKCL